jgi:hypothetical protein
MAWYSISVGNHLRHHHADARQHDAHEQQADERDAALPAFD